MVYLKKNSKNFIGVQTRFMFILKVVYKKFTLWSNLFLALREQSSLEKVLKT